MKFCKSLCICLSLAFFSAIFALNINAQERSRIIETEPNRIESRSYKQDSPPDSPVKIQRQIN